jgi:hypothetical protein
VGRRHARGRTGGARPDPFAVLGLGRDASVEQIESARKAFARSLHPDVGGSVTEMQRINAAADEAVRLVSTHPPPAPPPDPPAASAAAASTQPAMVWRFDHPSFTVEALPAAAFEALLVVATWLGETIDDDPPYRLDVEMTEPVAGWCRLDLVPDAGATTVSVTIGVERGAGEPDVELVRDAWIAGLNSLDWAEIGDSPRRP